MPLLDTSVLIDVSKGGRTPESVRAQSAMSAAVAASETLYTSRLNEAEFRVGQFRALNPAAEAAKIAAVLGVVLVLDFDAAAARTFAEIKASLRAAGRFPGDMDILVAAVALVHGFPVLTRNPRHFTDVPNLIVRAY